MERQTADRAKAALMAGKGQLVSYDLQYRKLGAVDLACGGAVDILIEVADRDRLPLFRTWLDGMERRRPVQTVTMLADRPRLGLAEVRLDPPESPGDVADDALVELHAPRPHVLLVGGGHINRALATLLDGLEYFYSVVDPRPEFASEERFPRARSRYTAKPEEWAAELELSDFTYAVVCSHSQSLDFEAVKGLVERGFAGGLGVIGSRSKRTDFERRLQGFDVSRIDLPIGLDIGAEGVEEIALSIAASLIRYHRIDRSRSGWHRPTIRTFEPGR